MNTLDIIVVLVVMLSAGFAYIRGFVRELLAIVAWLGAAVVGYYGYPYVAPFAERFLPRGTASNIAAGAAVFLVALIIFSILTGNLSKRVAQSGMSSFDRLFGLLFGVARGAVLVSLGFIALSWYYPPEKTQPDWVTQAHSRSLLQAGANMLESFVPKTWITPPKTTATRQPADSSAAAAAAANALASPKPGAKPVNPAPSYRAQDRADMDRLINQQQGQQQ